MSSTHTTMTLTFRWLSLSIDLHYNYIQTTLSCQCKIHIFIHMSIIWIMQCKLGVVLADLVSIRIYICSWICSIGFVQIWEFYVIWQRRFHTNNRCIVIEVECVKLKSLLFTTCSGWLVYMFIFIFRTCSFTTRPYVHALSNI